MRAKSNFGIALILAVASVGCGSDSPTQSDPESSTQYTNSLSGYSFTVPAGWQAEEDPTNRTRVFVTRPNEAGIMALAVQNSEGITYADLSNPSLLEGLERGLAGDGGATQYHQLSTQPCLLGTMMAVEIVWIGIIEGQDVKGQIILATDTRFVYMLLYVTMEYSTYSTFLGNLATVRGSFKGAPASKVARSAPWDQDPNALGEEIGRCWLRVRDR